jgi:thiazole/oxazole-forming peptide maturase SagC family component
MPIDDDNTDRFIALPVQFLKTDDGIILKRGITEIPIAHSLVAEVLRILLASPKDRGFTRSELMKDFHEADRPAVGNLVNKLIAHRFLVSEREYSAHSTMSESNLEIFCWQLGRRASAVTERINAHRIAILGINSISSQVAVSLIKAGATNVAIIDCPPLRNLKMLDNEGKLKSDEWPVCLQQPIEFEQWAMEAESWECVVATSDIGWQQSMRDLNRLCVNHKRHFLPVVLQDLNGYVGPFVIPGESPCFECFHARQNSQQEHSPRHTEGQAIVGFHPAMASIVADVAAFELIKFYGGPLPGYNIGAVIEINLLAARMTPRRLLKIPGCIVCSRSMVRSSILPYKDQFR